MRQTSGNEAQAFDRFIEPNPEKFFAYNAAALEFPMNGFFVLLRSRAFKICFNGKR